MYSFIHKSNIYYFRNIYMQVELLNRCVLVYLVVIFTCHLDLLNVSFYFSRSSKNDNTNYVSCSKVIKPC